MANTTTLDSELSMLLYHLTPASLRCVMGKVACYLRQQNADRITRQTNADGSVYAPRKSGARKPMLVGYARRIRERVEGDQAVVGVFGRMGNFGNVHDKGYIERRVKYPARNILALPAADKTVIMQMIRQHIGGAA
jgi:phage virion morphogenesis protein